MKEAPLPWNEKERIEALQNLEILDTELETEFQELAELAAFICGRPIALVSLVDSARQWFKSSVGLAAKETPREFAFCAHAILQNQVFEVPDATKDERFFDNPLVTGNPHVIHYAGAPISSSGQLPMGTLCVIDNKPGKLSSQQTEALSKLSHQVSKLLELRAKSSIAEQQNQKLRYYEIAIQNMNDGVVLQDNTGAIKSFNGSALRVLGMTEQQLLGKTSVDPGWHSIREDGVAFPGEEHPAMVTLRTGQRQSEVIMGVQTPNGETRWISINSEPIIAPDTGKVTHSVTTFSVTTFSDITEVRRNQTLLLDSARLSSLGEMASGIAHEINTPLGVIAANAELILSDFQSGELKIASLEKKVKKIETTAHKIGSIVRGLRTYARDGSKDPLQSLHILGVIEEGLSFCRERLKSNGVDLEVHCDHDFRVDCVPSQIGQVIVNLVSNAFDAVQNLSEKWVRIHVSAQGETGIIIVSDSGGGIPEQTLAKIMTPFFTTKQVGKGTGLGLSIS